MFLLKVMLIYDNSIGWPTSIKQPLADTLRVDALWRFKYTCFQILSLENLL